jgi:hypothetical protein
MKRALLLLLLAAAGVIARAKESGQNGVQLKSALLLLCLLGQAGIFCGLKIAMRRGSRILTLQADQHTLSGPTSTESCAFARCGQSEAAAGVSPGSEDRVKASAAIPKPARKNDTGEAFRVRSLCNQRMGSE